MFRNASEGPDNNTLRELRNTLKVLTEEIKISNTKSDRLNRALLLLTTMSTVLTIMQVIKLFK